MVFFIPTDTNVFFAPNFCFQCFRNTNIIFVSRVTVSVHFRQKYGNINGFSVFRSFSHLTTGGTVPTFRVRSRLVICAWRHAIEIRL